MGASGLGYRQIIGRFFHRLEAITAASWADPVSFYVPTNQLQEEYKWLGLTPPVREWVGGRAAKGFRENGITIVNKTFEATLDVPVDDLRRDKTGQMNVRIDGLAERVAEHWAKLLTALITTNPVCYDGQNFFDTDHSEGDSGAQVNALTNSHVPSLAVVASIAPTAAEMAKAILGVIAYMLTYKDDVGEPMMAAARRFMVMVPPALLVATEGALNLPVVQGTSGAINNPLAGQNRFAVDVEVNPRLTTGTVFYVFRTDGSTKAFIRQEELFETGMEDQTFLNNRLLFGVKAIRNVGCAFWQGAAQATLSNA